MAIGLLGMYILQIFSPVLWLLYYSVGDCLLLYLLMMCYSAQFLSFFLYFPVPLKSLPHLLLKGFCVIVLNILYLGVWSILSSFPYYSLTLIREYPVSPVLFVKEIVFSSWRDLGILVKLPSFLLLLAHCSVFYTTSTWFDSFCCIFLFQICLLLFEIWCF